jgi:hypothetical protein
MEELERAFDQFCTCHREILFGDLSEKRGVKILGISG